MSVLESSTFIALFCGVVDLDTYSLLCLTQEVHIIDFFCFQSNLNVALLLSSQPGVCVDTYRYHLV